MVNGPLKDINGENAFIISEYTSLGAPIKSNAIQYNSSSIYKIYTKTTMYSSN